MQEQDMVPFTILTGFLGSGKTTLLNRILKEDHGHRIAVIESEFGEVGVDNDIIESGDEQIVEMNNGCICCTVRGDLIRILGTLKQKRDQGALKFDRVVIETTGMADPGPVAQTFFTDEEIGNYYLLDSIITLVDAKHAPQQLDEFHEAQEQVGFADRILLSKTDLVSEDDAARLSSRLKGMNPRAPIKPVHMGQIPIADVLDVRGFNLNAVLDIDPEFLATEPPDAARNRRTSRAPRVRLSSRGLTPLRKCDEASADPHRRKHAVLWTNRHGSAIVPRLTPGPDINRGIRSVVSYTKRLCPISPCSPNASP